MKSYILSIFILLMLLGTGLAQNVEIGDVEAFPSSARTGWIMSK